MTDVKLMVALFSVVVLVNMKFHLNSAYSVAQGLKENFNLFPIGIAKDGQWYGPIPVAQIPISARRISRTKITILPFLILAAKFIVYQFKNH